MYLYSNKTEWFYIPTSQFEIYSKQIAPTFV